MSKAIELIVAPGETVMSALADSNVFEVIKTGDGRFEFWECCDNYFGSILTKEQVLTLADELRRMADELEAGK